MRKLLTAEEGQTDEMDHIIVTGQLGLLAGGSQGWAMVRHIWSTDTAHGVEAGVGDL